ncbi:MAG TPA: SIS domain-containing protein [Thermoanaerobaculia bacterium]|nr:SIS domain-containing protein [Thermoanaerobaculia bacterium]
MSANEAASAGLELPVATELAALGAARFERTRRALEAAFDTQADRLPGACRAMAARFHAGGRLLAWGDGAAASDAWHVAVEFVHPVIVGKRALPALVLDGDPLAALQLLGRPHDMVLAIASGGGDAAAARLLAAARRRGLLTLLLAGPAPAPEVEADFRFAVEDEDPMVVQEVHETLYHVLWELVHVFLEHPGLL